MTILSQPQRSDQKISQLSSSKSLPTHRSWLCSLIRRYITSAEETLSLNNLKINKSVKMLMAHCQAQWEGLDQKYILRFRSIDS
jgi:hypothetical protein